MQDAETRTCLHGGLGIAGGVFFYLTDRPADAVWLERLLLLAALGILAMGIVLMIGRDDALEPVPAAAE